MFQAQAVTQPTLAKIQHFKEITLDRAKDSSTFRMCFESAYEAFYV